MASLEDLKLAVKDALESRGVLDELRAAVRAEVFRTLDEGESVKPRPEGDTWLLNELIREYLTYHGLRHTLAVFVPEAGQPAEVADRQFLAQQSGLTHDATPHSVPMLYGLLAVARAHKAMGPR